MQENDKHAVDDRRSLGPKGNFWIRFILGAVAVFVIWVFVIRPNTIELNWAEQEQLLGLAREQLLSSTTGGGLIDLYPPELSERILRDGAAFVSLTVNGALRGCMIDQFQPHEPLVVNVLRNTELAVRGDDRFQMLTPEEIERARIAISVVYDVEPLSFDDERDLLRKLEPDRDGVILAIDQDIATYLPSVWQTFPDPAEFLSQLCIKAGWDANRWRMQPYPTISTYHVFAFEEPE